MTSNKKNIKILEDNPPVIKRMKQYIIEASKRINEIKTNVYRRLDNGYQFGGQLDQNFNGTGTLVNNNEEYYLYQCTIMNGVVNSYSQKRNLISNCQIVQNPIPDLTLEQLVAKLYTQYLSKEISHKIILFFTPQTNQFLNNNNQNDHQIFRNAYKDYVVIFIHLNNNQSLTCQQLDHKQKDKSQYAFILRNGEVDLICNNIKLSSQFKQITNFLDKMKYKKNRIHSCPCIYQDIGLNISQSLKQSLNQSIITISNLFSSTQFTPKYEQSKTNNGYFIIPLIVKAFDINKLDNQDIELIINITNQLHLRKCPSIYQRVESILQNKHQIYPLQEIMNDIYKRIQKDKNQFKILSCSSKI